MCTAGGYEVCQGRLMRLLERLVFVREITPDYTYYGIASPWLQASIPDISQKVVLHGLSS